MTIFEYLLMTAQRMGLPRYSIIIHHYDLEGLHHRLRVTGPPIMRPLNF